MVTTLIPIQISENPFWSSKKGIELIDDFLSLCAKISLIKNLVILSNDNIIRPSAQKYGIEILPNPIKEKIGTHYTYKQIISIAHNYTNTKRDKSEYLVIINHRNLAFDTEIFDNAIHKFKQNPEFGLISVSLCKDYPCQYISFYQFIACKIIHCKHNNNFRSININLPKKNKPLTICLAQTNSGFHIDFKTEISKSSGYVVKLTPFDSNGIRYHQDSELFVNKQNSSFFLNICPKTTEGIIVNIFIPSQSGEYDTMEIFTPRGAPWELSGEGNTLIDINTDEPIFGRQQFSEAYSYDGNINIFLSEKIKDNEYCKLNVPKHFILNKSSIVNNQIEYLNASHTLIVN
ncbi:MAG: hypothetical protein HQK65_20565 [Desulfamplus sp.]|nr:hypothetical protein [Desulfamplus sp.]